MACPDLTGLPVDPRRTTIEAFTHSGSNSCAIDRSRRPLSIPRAVLLPVFSSNRQAVRDTGQPFSDPFIGVTLFPGVRVTPGKTGRCSNDFESSIESRTPDGKAVLCLCHGKQYKEFYVAFDHSSVSSGFFNPLFQLIQNVEPSTIPSP